jgi:hypothetical protein
MAMRTRRQDHATRKHLGRLAYLLHGLMPRVPAPRRQLSLVRSRTFSVHLLHPCADFALWALKKSRDENSCLLLRALSTPYAAVLISCNMCKLFTKGSICSVTVCSCPSSPSDPCPLSLSSAGACVWAGVKVPTGWKRIAGVAAIGLVIVMLLSLAMSGRDSSGPGETERRHVF